MTTDMEKKCEEAFEAYWHGTFKGMSPEDYIKYKSVGKSGECRGFIAGAKWAMEEMKKDLETCRNALKTIKHTECDTYRVAADALFATNGGKDE